MNSPIRPQASMEFRFVFDLSETEARFLDALVGYGSDSLLKVFHALCGTAYSQAHEKAVPEFCNSVHDQLSAAFGRLDDTRQVFNRTKIAVRPNEKP